MPVPETIRMISSYSWEAKSCMSLHPLFFLVLFVTDWNSLTSYDEIRMSYPIKPKDKPDMSPEDLLNWGMQVYTKSAGSLHRIRFRRIILDEGQQIRNPEAQTSIAVRALHGHYKWILSGTPLLK